MGGAVPPPGVDDAGPRAKRRDPAGGHALPGPIGVDDALPLDSTPVVAAKPPPATVAGTTKINGVDFIVLEDGIKSGTGADTAFDVIVGTVPGYAFEGDKVTRLAGPIPVPSMRIQTSYAPSASPTGLSGYGRGTTDEDKKAGNVTLGFHESCHHQDFKTFVADNTPPAFTGKVGMTKAEYTAATQKYGADCAAYKNKALKYSADKTDEVGSPPKSRYHP